MQGQYEQLSSILLSQCGSRACGDRWREPHRRTFRMSLTNNGLSSALALRIEDVPLVLMRAPDSDALRPHLHRCAVARRASQRPILASRSSVANETAARGSGAVDMATAAIPFRRGVHPQFGMRVRDETMRFRPIAREPGNCQVALTSTKVFLL